MRSKYLELIAVIAVLLTLTGCWDSNDIQTKNILTTIIIDYKDDEYCFYSEIANILGQSPKTGEKANKANFSTLFSKEKTYEDTRDRYDRRTDQQTFLGATRILIITNRLAEEKGIEEYINRLRGQYDYRKSISIVTTSDEPMEILKIEPENAISPGFSIEDNLSALVNNGTNFEFNFGNVLEVIAVKKAGFLLPSYRFEEKELTFNGYSVFKDAKRIGEIPPKDRNGIVYLLNPNSKFLYHVDYNSTKFIIKVNLKDKKIKTDYRNDQLKFDVNTKFTAEIMYSDKAMNITEKDKAEITKELEKNLKEDIVKAIDTSQQEFKCDYLEFYKFFRAKYQKEFKTMDWCKVYSNAKMNVSVKANIASNKIPEENG